MRKIQDEADQIRDRILEAMDEALSNLRPAQLWFSARHEQTGGK
jgi:hypothetical protein